MSLTLRPTGLASPVYDERRTATLDQAKARFRDSWDRVSAK
jgi:hypothetical protein